MVNQHFFRHFRYRLTSHLLLFFVLHYFCSRLSKVGCYDKVPDDGREFVSCDVTVVKIRAEDGRRISNVDISPFISNLPFQVSTEEFSTDDASGSTSQAAAIVEALEVI
jgi:predicted ABC-class ATPase